MAQPAADDAPVAPNLRITDFRPKPFDGETIDYDLCHAHYLSFYDYLVQHDLNEPDFQQLVRVNTLFRTTLVGKARLWAEGKVYTSLGNLRQQFLQRFSPSHSTFGNVKHFHSLSHITGDSAEETLNKIKLAAQRIGYADPQVRDKFLQVLPANCQAAVIMSSPADATVQDLAQRAQQFFDFSPQGDTATSAKQVTFDQVHFAQTSEPTADKAVSDLASQMAQLNDELQQLKLRDSIHYSQDQSRTGHFDSRRDRSTSPHPSSGASRRSRDEVRSSNSGDRNDRYRYSSRSNSRSRGPSRSPYRNFRQSPRHESRRQPVHFTCHFCGKPNHKWRNCYAYRNSLQGGSNPPYFPTRPASGLQHQTPPGQFRSQYNYDPAQTYDYGNAQTYPLQDTRNQQRQHFQ